MILYCDTSALIKRYVEEGGSARVNAQWDASEAIGTSVVAFAETLTAFGRRLREGSFTAREYGRPVAAFKRDYPHLVLVPISDELNELIEVLVKKHPLRGFDAIHLASALLLHRPGGLDVSFACFDRNLNAAARSEGLMAAV